MIEIRCAGFRLVAAYEEALAPKTCIGFLALLPLSTRLIHARWSGEAGWVPFGDLDTGLGYENATSYPAPGELLFFPGGISETELLFPYGATAFASTAGPLAGNHFATVREGTEHLREIGRLILWEGAQQIEFRATAADEAVPRTERTTGRHSHRSAE